MHIRQKGATIWVNLIWVLMGVSIAVIGLKVIPVYLDSYTVTGALDGLKSQPDLAKLKDKDIHKILEKQFQINSVRHIKKDHILIQRNKKSKKLENIQINYEVREHLFYNVDLVLTFKNHLDVQ